MFGKDEGLTDRLRISAFETVQDERFVDFAFVERERQQALFGRDAAPELFDAALGTEQSTIGGCGVPRRLVDTAQRE